MVFVCPGKILQLGTAIGNLDEGTIITLNENGNPVEFYVAKQDYESGLNGAGRALLVRKDCYGSMAWNSVNVNAWASTTLLAWLNGDYKALLDADVQVAVGATTYYYTPGNGNYAVTTRADAIFQLSITELGKSNSRANVEGSALPIADTLGIAYFNGSSVYQSTRTPNNSNTNYYCVVKADGSISATVLASTAYYCRPCFTLPATFKLSDSQIIS